MVPQKETFSWVERWSQRDGPDTSCSCMERRHLEDEQPSERELGCGIISR